MEQFRQIGEALGSLKALMVFRNSIQINQRQCILLHDIFSYAYDSISEEMKQNLKYEEKNIRWKVLEQPFRELNRVFREGEAYIRNCLDLKDWWAKAITLCRNTDCVEFHIHNLLCCITVVVEAIENAAELSGLDFDELQKRRRVYSNKYQKEWTDPQIFQWKFAKQYLVTQEIRDRVDAVWREDRWILLNKIKERKHNTGTTKQERRFTNIFSTEEALNGKLLPSTILVGSKGYQLRRRLGSGSQYKEIIWLGESFAVRHFFGDIEALTPEISSLLSLSHPNILYFLGGFCDEEKKECYLLMELMSKSLGSHIEETCNRRKRNLPFSLPVAVDLMLQIARGMEYLHSKKIYHGELNPSNIHVKARSVSVDGYLQAKVSGFGLSSVRNLKQKSKNSNNQENETLPFIWHAPEVLEEQELTGTTLISKYTDKADVYSFGMVCFELVTGKVPFEDSHLQGDKMSRNIRAGERPLFPFHSPRFISNLTKRCWHADPNQRPNFPSICRILRYIKRFLAMNPDFSNQPEQIVPMGDYYDIESKLLKKFPSLETPNASATPQIPFHMFVYKVIEKEKSGFGSKDTSESGSDRASFSGDETAVVDDPFSVTERRCTLLPSPDGKTKKQSAFRRSLDIKPRQSGTPRGRSVRPPQISPPCGRRLRMNSESQIMMGSPRMRRSFSGHVSDSELP